MYSGVKAVFGFGSFVVCGRLVSGDRTVACLEEDACMFVDAFIFEVQFSEVADVIDDVVRGMKFESA